MQEENTDTVKVPEEWLKRAQKQKKRLEELTLEERKAWGFTEPTLEAQRKKDEKNSSK